MTLKLAAPVAFLGYHLFLDNFTHVYSVSWPYLTQVAPPTLPRSLPRHLPSNLMSFVLNNPPGLISTTHMRMGKGPSTRPWAAYQQPQPGRRITLPQQPSVKHSSSTGNVPSPAHAGMLTGLILCRSRISNHNCCAFMSGTAKSLERDSVLQHSLTPSGSYIFFYILFLDEPWKSWCK